jgi:hypothetical protein
MITVLNAGRLQPYPIYEGMDLYITFQRNQAWIRLMIRHVSEISTALQKRMGESWLIFEYFFIVFIIGV